MQMKKTALLQACNTKNNIKIIRLGLHYSDSLVNNSYGDNYHPAFKELCENKLFYDKFIEKAKDFPDLNEIKTVVISVEISRTKEK